MRHDVEVLRSKIPCLRERLLRSVNSAQQRSLKSSPDIYLQNFTKGCDTRGTLWLGPGKFQNHRDTVARDFAVSSLETEGRG